MDNAATLEVDKRYRWSATFVATLKQREVSPCILPGETRTLSGSGTYIARPSSPSVGELRQEIEHDFLEMFNREWGNRIGLASYEFTFTIDPA